MLYRRKIILALLQIFDGELEKIRLQKLLFLFTKRQGSAKLPNGRKSYDFVPYKYGCFSFSANADLIAMVRKGVLTQTETCFRRNEKTDYLKSLEQMDYKHLQEVKQFYGKMDVHALMQHTYINYPYWAINSKKAQSILTEEKLKEVNKIKPKGTKTILFTIGYEGISLEEYLNRLLKNDIKILIDVRRNPLSMKYGFNKNQLKHFCENIDIQYLHFPEAGIRSEQRQELNTQTDYDNLFAIYRKENLAKTLSTQIHILNLLKSHKRIALTCFEANINKCHRKHLAEAIQTLQGFEYEINHI